MKIQIVGIRSYHVDFFCRICCTAFDLKHDDYVECPYCKKLSHKEYVDKCRKQVDNEIDKFLEGD
jgi:DNA-directed RNA polymerase subunit RPC12/RpoP